MGLHVWYDQLNYWISGARSLDQKSGISRQDHLAKMVLTFARASLLLMCAVHCGTAQLQAPVQGPSSEVMTSRREIDVAFICSQGCC